MARRSWVFCWSSGCLKSLARTGLRRGWFDPGDAAGVDGGGVREAVSSMEEEGSAMAARRVEGPEEGRVDLRSESPRRDGDVVGFLGGPRLPA